MKLGDVLDTDLGEMNQYIEVALKYDGTQMEAQKEEPLQGIDIS